LNSGEKKGGEEWEEKSWRIAESGSLGKKGENQGGKKKKKIVNY